jgi:biopolymer transport protein TolQ
MTDSYSIALKSRSIFDIIYEADVVVQLVVLALLLASIWSWSIILNKMIRFREVKRRDKSFSKVFDSKSSFGEILESVRNRAGSPMEQVFISTVNEMKNYNLEELKSTSEEKRSEMKMRLHSAMMHARNKYVGALERNLGHLATIASAAPFIGLFGTVWGIMRSFQAIAFSKNTSLAVVAPGIAEALFATALGLVAAIPALMFYNILLGKITSLENNLDDFLVKLNNKIEMILKF